MNRQASYTYSHSASSTQRYSGTSSAFSASANPNEDWTKISDLAERRRIQNRIAQRNYRKKLKKRLEHLERRAASSSASPEQQPAELERSNSQLEDDYRPAEAPVKRTERPNQRRRTPASSHDQHLTGRADRVFSHQHTRQPSTSPPPFSYTASYPSETISYASYPQHTTYHGLPSMSAEISSFSPCLPPLIPTYPSSLPTMIYPAKHSYYEADEISPFSMNFATMAAGIDVSAGHSYHDSNPHTPPLSDCFELSAAESPPDSSYVSPTTPELEPTTSPFDYLSIIASI